MLYKAGNSEDGGRKVALLRVQDEVCALKHGT